MVDMDALKIGPADPPTGDAAPTAAGEGGEATNAGGARQDKGEQITGLSSTIHT